MTWPRTCWGASSSRCASTFSAIRWRSRPRLRRPTSTSRLWCSWSCSSLARYRRNVINNFKIVINFSNRPIHCSFSSLQCCRQIIQSARVWIRTANLYCGKRPYHKLCDNHNLIISWDFDAAKFFRLHYDQNFNNHNKTLTIRWSSRPRGTWPTGRTRKPRTSPVKPEITSPEGATMTDVTFRV